MLILRTRQQIRMQTMRVSTWVAWWWQGEPYFGLFLAAQDNDFAQTQTRRHCRADLVPWLPGLPGQPVQPSPMVGCPCQEPARTSPPNPYPSQGRKEGRNSSSSCCRRSRPRLTTSHCPSPSQLGETEVARRVGVLDQRRGCLSGGWYPACERTSQAHPPRRYVHSTHQPQAALMLNFPAELGPRPSLLPLEVAWFGP
jgi:hypothetical protein